MNTTEKKSVAVFMNFPTTMLRGRITNGLADNSYNDWISIMEVVKKIESLIFPDEHGDFKTYVTISGDYCAIKLSRVRINTDFKRGITDEKTIIYNSSPTKFDTVRRSVVEFINWYNKDQK